MSGGKVDIAARQAWFEEQAAHAESEWIDSFQERFEYGDDVPDKEHFIALWLAERDPLATDLAAAIARAEAAERIGLELQGRAQRAESALSECYEWLFESKSDGPRVSQGALDNGSYTREYHELHERLSAAIAAQQAEGES